MKAIVMLLSVSGWVGLKTIHAAEIREFTWQPGSTLRWHSAGNWIGPSGQYPDDSYDRAILGPAAANPALERNVQGNVGYGLGQLVFNSAGWSINNEPGGDYTIYFNSVPEFTYNAIFSRGTGINTLDTRIEFYGAAQNIYTASGNTLVLKRGVAGSYAPVISSENPTAVDTGAVRLDAASSVSEPFYLRQGMLLVRHSQGLGTASTMNIGGDSWVSDGAHARLLTDAAGVTITPNITVRAYPDHEVNATLGGNQTSGASSFAGTITLQRDARFTSANTDGQAVAFNNAISGMGGVTKVGVGTVALNHANTYAGATEIQAGTLRLGAVGALPEQTRVTLANASDVVLDLNGHNQTVAGLFGGGGRGGAVMLGTATLTVGDGEFAGVISGGGGLRKTGSGILTLSGANTYSGPTLIAGGTLAYGTHNVLGGGSVTVSGPTSTLQLGPYSDSVGLVTLENDGQIAGSGTLTSTAGFELLSGTVNVPLGGSVPLQKTTLGTVSLNAANPLAGETRVIMGTLRLGHALALQNSTVNLEAADTGTLDLNGLSATLGGLRGSRDLAAPDGRMLSVGENQASLTYAGRLSGKNITLRKVGSGTWTLTGEHLFTGQTQVLEGTLSLGDGDSSGWLSTPIQNEAALVFNRADHRLFDQPIRGSGSLIKLGRGTLTLSADNEYTGGTYIRDGVLNLLGWNTSSLYEVGEGIASTTPALGGAGTLLGNARIFPGAELWPGLSLGTLTIQGDVSLSGTLAIELDGTGPGSNDRLEVGGLLDLTGGSLRLAVLSELDDEAYVFASYGMLKGEPFGSVLNLPDGYRLDYHYQGLNQIALVVIPEPPPQRLLVLALIGLGFMARHRR